MQKMLFLFLMLPFSMAAQKPEWNIAFTKSFPPELGKPLSMPEIDYNTDFSIEDQFRPRTQKMYYRVFTDSAYRKIYHRYVFTADSISKYEKNGADSFTLSLIKKYQRDSIPSFDFDNYNMIIYSACPQCLAHCKHGQGQQSCHRNACFYRHAWFKELKPEKLPWD